MVRALVVVFAVLLLAVPAAKAGIPGVTCANDPVMPTWASGDYTDEGRIILRPYLCGAISRAQAGKIANRVQLEMAALGVFMLAHELAHARGVRDSNITATGEDSDAADCAAWRTFGSVAASLRISSALAEVLKRQMTMVGVPACMREAKR